MKDDPDVLVIGAGAVGLCSAYYLARQGVQVSLVEQGDIASGCSGANAGLIVPSHAIPLATPRALRRVLLWMLKPESPFTIKLRLNSNLFHWLRLSRSASKFQRMHEGLRVLRELNSASFDLLEQLIKDESLACDYQQKGWLMVYKTRQGFQEAVEEARLLESHGIELKVLSTEETLMKESMLIPKISGSVLFPKDAHLDPEEFSQALAECLREKGVAIHTKTKVHKFETSNGSVTKVITTGGEWKPGEVVLTAGAWSSGLLQKLGFRLPLQPAKGYSLSIKQPEASPSIPLYLSEAKVAVTPLKNVLRFSGTLELAGMDLSMNERRLEAIIRAAGKYLTRMENLNTGKIWCGLRPLTPDGLPIICRLFGYKNLIIATGHGILGMTQAPITGKLVSQLACEQTPVIELKPLGLIRFR